MEKLLTAKEVAKILNCHPQSVYRNQDIPRVELPGIGVRFKESDIYNLIDQRTVKPILNLTSALSPSSIRLDNLAKFDRMFLELQKGDGGSMSKKKTRWNYGFGSVYIRKTKQGKERWYVDYQASGERIREVVANAQNKAEAVLHLQEKIKEAFSGVYDIKTKVQISFSEFSEVYLRDYAKQNKKSWKDDMYRINAHMKPFFEGYVLDEINPHLIENYKAERLKSTARKSKEKISRSSINRELTILKKMLNLAVDWGHLSSNPTMKIKLFSEKDNLMERILTKEEEKRLLEAAAKELKPILVIALNTGMRRGEILNLEWEQIDFERKQIRVEHTKNGKTRIIPVNSELSVLLNDMNRARNADFLFENPRTGKPLTNVNRSFKTACRKASLKDLRFHDLRHSFASRLVESGVDLITVKELLGHSTVRVTERYTHPNQEQKKRAVEILAQKPSERAKITDELAHRWHTEDRGKKENGVFPLFSVN